ncbi:hypothetical protein VTG60DRAFT_1242 [Thermothelomyces hinnuleus]
MLACHVLSVVSPISAEKCVPDGPSPPPPAEGCETRKKNKAESKEWGLTGKYSLTMPSECGAEIAGATADQGPPQAPPFLGAWSCDLLEGGMASLTGVARSQAWLVSLPGSVRGRPIELARRAACLVSAIASVVGAASWGGRGREGRLPSLETWLSLGSPRLCSAVGRYIIRQRVSPSCPRARGGTGE